MLICLKKQKRPLYKQKKRLINSITLSKTLLLTINNKC